MKIRLLILFLLVLARMGFLWVQVFGWQEGDFLQIKGKVVKIYQKQSVCEVGVGRFVIKTQGWCDVTTGTEVEIVGRVESDLLNSLVGVTLIDGRLNVLDKNTKDIGFVRVKKVFGGWQAQLSGIVSRFLPAPEDSLVTGIVLGDRDLPYQFKQDLIETGLIHIVVASGFNVMIVGMMVLSLCFYLMRRGWASLVAIIVMLFYALLAGFDPPVVRAVIMGGVVLWSAVLGRRTGGLWSLFVACVVMFLVSPEIILSISFQLSVAASFGLLVVAPWLEKKGIWNVVAVALGAQMAALPVVYFYFGRVSLIGLVANIFVLPLVPVIMLLGSLLLVIALIWQPAGFLVSWAVYSLAHLLVKIMALFV